MKPAFLIGLIACGLAFLVGCSTPTPPPATHPTWCNKDPEKEPHIHCNGNIYLPGHEPEECITPEQIKETEPAQSTLLASRNDFFGTYVINYTDSGEGENLMRIYSDGTASIMFRAKFNWTVRNGQAHFYKVNRPQEDADFVIAMTGTRANRNFIQLPGSSWGDFDLTKESADPDHLIDFFVLRHGPARPNKGNTKLSWCSNFGIGEVSGYPWPHSRRAPPVTYRDGMECLDSCELLKDYYAKHSDERLRKTSVIMECP